MLAIFGKNKRYYEKQQDDLIKNRLICSVPMASHLMQFEQNSVESGFFLGGRGGGGGGGDT